MILIIGSHISLTSKDVLAVFPPRSEATRLPNDAPHVKANYNWHQIAQQIKVVYQQAIDEK